MKHILIAIIRVYQLSISPFLGQNCCFYPSCSQYSIEAIVKYGVFKGTYLTIKRIIRCTPWSKGGVDPLP